MTFLRPSVFLASSLLSALLSGCPGPEGALDCGACGDTAPWDAPSDTGVRLDAPGADTPSMDTPGADTPAVGDAPVDAPLTTSREIISPRCGPADGFALELGIYPSATMMCMGDPLEQSLVFFVHDLGGATLPPTSGTVITSSASSANGQATDCPGGLPPCRVSETWTLTFTDYTDGVGARGSYTVTWGDGTSSSGNFTADWCSTGPLLCG